MSGPGGTLSLYLHIPFCDRRCPYCHFTCFVNRDPTLPLRYVRALAREYALYRHDFPGPISTVYIGGGTPTALDAPAREFLCAWFTDELAGDLSAGAEITLEVNPESAWPETIDPWIEAGVNRLSLGVQSMDPQVLEFLGRLNTPASNRRACALAAGRVDNLSVDFILSTPADSLAAMENSLNLVEEFPITHVSAYLLEIHPTTRFGREVQRGTWVPLPTSQQADRYLRAVEILRERGLLPYELSNFAREGMRCRHNQAYWTGANYLGLGVSAHSHHQGTRWWNLENAARYCQSIEEGILPVAGKEELSSQQKREEEVLLGLRTLHGLDASWEKGHRELWREWIGAGYAVKDGQRLVLTAAGWLVMDEIALRLLGAT